MNHRERGKPAGRTFSNGSLHITGTSVINSESSRKTFSPLVNFTSLIPSTRTTNKKTCDINHVNHFSESECTEMSSCGTIIIRAIGDGRIEASRVEKERERNPDRLSLDKRSLTTMPILLNESKLRLLSLQHNLLIKLEQMSLERLTNLVFLDVYNNQLESMASLNYLKNLRVLLLGKNRIKFIENLDNLTKLEVLDLHGNQIIEVNGLVSQKELKVLNLAGNEIKMIGSNDLKGLHSLQELNIRRNRIKRILGFHETPHLLKLFLSSNEIASISDMENLKHLRNLKEIGLEGNPVYTVSECVLFIVSYLPAVAFIDRVAVTEDIMKRANEWRKTMEDSKDKSELVTVDTTITTTTTSSTSVNVGDKMNQSVTPNRLRSSSRDRIPVRSRTTESAGPVKRVPALSIEKELGRKFPPKSAQKNIQLITKLRRRRFFEGRFASSATAVANQSFNESESGGDRLPPILCATPTGQLDDNSDVALKNEPPGTSLESNKSYRSDNAALLSRNDDNRTNNNGELSSSCSSVIDDEDDNNNNNNDTEDAKGVPEKLLSVDCKSIPEWSDINYGHHNAGNVSSPSILIGKNAARSRITTAVSKMIRRKKCQRLEKVLERGGDYFVEIAGRYLNVSGKNSAKFIDRAWNPDKAADVCTVRFTSVNFDSLTSTLNKIKFRFSNAEHFVFADTGITVLGQLNALADIQGLTSLHIVPDGNPIASKPWQNYAIFRLHHWGLRYVDNVAITDEQIALACEEYKGLGDVVFYSLPDCLLSPLLNKLHLEVNNNASPKQWLYNADPTLRDVICKEALQWRSPNSLTQTDELLRDKGRNHLTRVVNDVYSSINKLKMLENKWPFILQKIVRDTLTDFSDMEAYVKSSMEDMNNP